MLDVCMLRKPRTAYIIFFFCKLVLKSYFLKYLSFYIEFIFTNSNIQNNSSYIKLLIYILTLVTHIFRLGYSYIKLDNLDVPVNDYYIQVS